jgi:hypothetical protein
MKMAVCIYHAVAGLLHLFKNKKMHLDLQKLRNMIMCIWSVLNEHVFNYDVT